MAAAKVLIAGHSQTKYFKQYVSSRNVDMMSFSGFRVEEFWRKKIPLLPTLNNYEKSLQLLFVSTVVLMVVITLGLSIYRGVVLGQYGGLYFMLGICLIGFVAVEIVLVAMIRHGDLAKEKLWFLYFMGVCIMLEAIFTNVLLFR